MKPPYFIVTAICRTKACTATYFSKNRKVVDKMSASGSPYRVSRLVCEKCGMWADVTEIEEVMQLSDEPAPCCPTCQGHVTHPCEKCGRQWNIRPAEAHRVSKAPGWSVKKSGMWADVTEIEEVKSGGAE